MRTLITTLFALATAFGAQAETKLVLNKTGVAPSLDTQQISVPEGQRVVLSIPVLSGNVWFKNGSPIPGANGRALVIDSAKLSDSGLYKVGYVGIHSVDSQAVDLRVLPRNAPTTTGNRLLTFTTRGVAGSGAHSLVAGFIVGEDAALGGGSKRLLVRAVGPTLEDLGVTGYLSTPLLSVYDSSGKRCEAITTDAKDLSNAQLVSGAYPLKSGAADAWQILRLTPGSYTAQVTSGGAAPGFVLLEVWDLP